MDDFQKEILDIFCDEVDDLLAEWNQTCTNLNSAFDPEKINTLYRIAHNIKGGSRVAGLVKVGELLHHVEDEIGSLKTASSIPKEFVVALFQVSRTLSEWFISIRQDFTEDPAPDNIADLLLALKNIGSEDGPPEKDKVTNAETNKAITPSVRNNKRKPQKATTLRVSTEKLDSLLQVVRELRIQNEIIHHCRKRNSLESKLGQDALDLIDKGCLDLQNTAMSLRMFPVKPLFDSLQQTITEISLVLEKNVNIEIVGEDLELDRSTIESLKDPLIHIVRNAIDHGIEDPEKRKSYGKTEQATIWIRAIQNAHNLVFEISDDGQGIPLEKIKSKAIEAGVIKAEESISDEEILQLVFHPGLSTAEEVSDISGRGVGMDVVNSAVRAQGGQIVVDSEPHKGTTFKISLPTELNVVNAVVISIQGNLFAVPLSEISEIINFEENQIREYMGQHQALNWRDSVIPILSTKDFLKIPKAKSRDETLNFQNRKKARKKSYRFALIVNNGKKQAAFEVDDILDQQPIVVNELNNTAPYSIGISGGTILSNGEPGYILDFASIVRSTSYLKGA